MITEKIVLKKGESIKFLDYTIKNSLNNDGLVLFKDSKVKGCQLYECHLGNYGTGTEENVTLCKLYAVYYFMAARPQDFATTMVNKAKIHQTGTYHEYYKFKSVCEQERIELPEEIGASRDGNAMILFNGTRI